MMRGGPFEPRKMEGGDCIGGEAKIFLKSNIQRNWRGGRKRKKFQSISELRSTIDGREIKAKVTSGW